MPAVPALSDAEWQVMQVIWDESPLTSAEVVQRIKPQQSWSPATVKTLLGRLVRKGALTYAQQGNRYHYRPCVSRSACLRQVSRGFLRKICGGDAAGMLAHLVRQVDLQPAEIEQLRKMLDEKEGER